MFVTQDGKSYGLELDNEGVASGVANWNVFATDRQQVASADVNAAVSDMKQLINLAEQGAPPNDMLVTDIDDILVNAGATPIPTPSN